MAHDRLNTLDVSFLYLEESTTPMHVGGVVTFEAPTSGFDYDTLVSLIGERIGFVPRYRQRIRTIPGRLANPVWVDDENFDITYHVRRSALPRPGTDAQLRDLVGRLMGRRLDRERPLWEIYLVEGLEHDRFAIITKTHHAMVDGMSAIDIGQILLDTSPTPRHQRPEPWSPKREPGSVSLVGEAVLDLARRPSQVVDSVRTGVGDARRTAGKALGTLAGVAATLRVAARPAPSSPLNAPIGKARRFGTADTLLDDYKRIRKVHGGTVNDVVLATVSGALRAWMLTRGEAVQPSTTVRAMVPVSVRAPDESGQLGNRVAAFIVDLPVGEASPVIRLQRISYAMTGLKENGQALGADALVSLAGFAPPTIHSLGARVGNGLSRRLWNLVVTNVPGPQFPLYSAGAKMLTCYPVVPLSQGQVVTIGLTSYNGGVYYGLNADRDALPDVDVLAHCIEEALEELLETLKPRAGAPRRQRARPNS